MLLIKRKDDARASKVLAQFRTSCTNAAQLLWEFDDADVAELQDIGINTDRTPVVVAFDNGEQIMDFVAQTPSALFYGLQDCAALRDAYL